MEENTTLLEKTNESEEPTAVNDKNGIFSIEQTENGCCLHVNSEENCVPYLLGAISKYAESHDDFKMELVELSAKNEADAESEEDDRWQVDEQFTVVDCASGKKMIFNKAENKAFTFQFIDDSDPTEPKTIDVMEFAFCERVAHCVYAFRINSEDDIGLVDVQTGTVINPKFIDLFDDGVDSDSNGSFLIGIYIEEWMGMVCLMQIDKWTLSVKDVRQHEITYEDGKYKWNDFTLKKIPGFFVDYQDYGNPTVDDHNFYYNNFYSYFGLPGVFFIIESSNQLFNGGYACLTGFSDNKIEIYAINKCYGIKYDGKYYYVDEVKCDYVSLVLESEYGPRFSVSDYGPLFSARINNKFAFGDYDRIITAFDFTSGFKYLYHIEIDCFFLAEIYGKKGVIAYNIFIGSTVTTILPFEFDSIEYFEGKNDVCITDAVSGEQKHYNYDNVIVAKKMGMCAAFDKEGKRLTPFVREERFLISSIPAVEDFFDTSSWGLPVPDDN